jgi:Ca2+-binding RTX toxin-like protein
VKRDRLVNPRVLALALALGVGLLAPAPAAADSVACSFLPGGGPLPIPPLVSVQITPGGGPSGSMERLGGGNEIVAFGSNGLVSCGGGTVLNTALITLGDASPQGQGDVSIFHIPLGTAAHFSPGIPDEPGDSDEIEFGVAFGPGKDTLGLDAIHGDGGASTIRLGTDGEHDYINVNAAEMTGIDQDISMEGVDRVVFEAGTEQVADDIRGIGGAGTGNMPLPLRMSVHSGAGNDLAIGGSAGDLFDGGPGSDTLIGMAGPSSLEGGAGADSLFGGPQPDLFFGDDAADTIYGRGRHDLLQGDAGADLLRGGRGPDELKGGPGADVLGGGTGFDICVGGTGNDSFTGCEKISP